MERKKTPRRPVSVARFCTHPARLAWRAVAKRRTAHAAKYLAGRTAGPAKSAAWLGRSLLQHESHAFLGGAAFSPMSLTLPERWDSALIVGRTPWGVPSGPRDALVPLLPRRIRHLRSLRSRPGGRRAQRAPPRASAPPSDADGRTWQSKWHWDAILPHLGQLVSSFWRAGGAKSRGRGPA